MAGLAAPTTRCHYEPLKSTSPLRRRRLSGPRKSAAAAAGGRRRWKQNKNPQTHTESGVFRLFSVRGIQG